MEAGEQITCNLNAMQWKVLSDVDKLLSPFMLVQKALEGEKYVTISLIPFSIAKVRSGLQEAVRNGGGEGTDAFQSTAQKLLADFNTRWGTGDEGTVFRRDIIRGDRNREVGLQPNILLAAACDPRMKSLTFIPDMDKREIWDAVFELMVTRRLLLEAQQRKFAINNEIDEDSDQSDNDEQANQRQRLNEAGEHADIFVDLQQQHDILDAGALQRTTRDQIEDQLRIELRSYRQEPHLNMYADETRQAYNNPLEWWKTKQALYPNVALLAKRLLCIPATSAPAERLFSHAGLVLSKLRASLNPDNAQNLILLHDNWKLVEEYSGDW